MFLPDFIKKGLQYGLIIFSFFSIYKTTASIIETSRKGEVLASESKNLNVQKKELEDKFLVINSEEFVEKEARTRLNMKKEGEEVFFIPNSPVSDKDAEDYSSFQEVAPQKNKSNVERWFELLF